MNNSRQPKVAIITLNYNQEDYSIDCVESLLKSDYSNFEILLIDNGSNRENFKILNNSLPEDKRLNIIRLEKNIGYVGGVNFGLQRANQINCEYFLIMNNDTIIDENAIKELIFTSEKYEGKAIVSGKVYNYDEKDYLQYIGQDFDSKNMLNQKSYIKNRREKDIGQYDEEIEMGMLDDIYWIFSKGIFDKVGFYSDYFFLYGEQNDYAFRAIKNGFKLIYTHKAKLWHKGAVTTTGGDKWLKSPKIEYWGTMAVLKLSVLHLSEEKGKLFRRKYIFRNTIKRVFQLLTGKIKFNILKSHFMAVRHFKYWNIIRYKDNGYNPFS